MIKQKQKLIGIVSLGCDKNRVDTELMLTRLRAEGFTFTSDPFSADAIIVNTCAFIKSARDEAENTIREMIDFKTKGSCKKLIVTGCYPQKDSKTLQKKFPEVDVFLGTNEYMHIAPIIINAFNDTEPLVKTDTKDHIDFCEEGRLITTPGHYAYLKIAEGCDSFCSYCTIPYIRGRLRSRKIESLVKEATYLANQGVREIILVAQDITKYGIDIYKKPQLAKLLQKLYDVDGLEWIRLLYAYPESIDEIMIKEITQNPKICNYIDIPIQHVSDSVLKRMNRKTNRETIEGIIKKIRAAKKYVAIRTTFIVGFPGETKQDFDQLIDFLKEYKLDHVGIFMYSQEEGTVAAGLENQVSEVTKLKRYKKAMQVQKKIVLQNNKRFVGQTLRVVFEELDYKKRLFVGRTEYQSPEVDTVVYFSSDKPVEIGKFYDVEITKVCGYDLMGKAVSGEFYK